MTVASAATNATGSSPNFGDRTSVEKILRPMVPVPRITALRVMAPQPRIN
ncbi:MAG TPA: hypothetical protein VII29_12200 [Terriglobales bacterium]